MGRVWPQKQTNFSIFTKGHVSFLVNNPNNRVLQFLPANAAKQRKEQKTFSLTNQDVDFLFFFTSPNILPEHMLNFLG